VTIHFLPNDFLSQTVLPLRAKEPRPDRPADRAGYAFAGAAAEGAYAPGTPGFLFWQCREAALAALEAWERLDGPVPRWARARPDRRKLKLVPNSNNPLCAGARRLNAFYDGRSLQFFDYDGGGHVTSSGASTDVVAHETGHALLDVIRPDLWDQPVTEAAALHESFGDCTALLTALADQPTREALLLASPDLGTANFVEALGEDLADGVRRVAGARHPSSQPRHALNPFRWQLPSTLPGTGPPGRPTSEAHSFSRVFTGCFYDAVRGIFARQPRRDQADLWVAAETAARLLIAAARWATDTARLFQAVGRGMVLADERLNQGANGTALRQAFANHDVGLGSAVTLAPTATLAGPAPDLSPRARKPLLSAATRKDLLKRIDAPPRSRLVAEAAEVAGQRVVRAVHTREVPLGRLDRRLRGVVARAAEPVLVGAAGDRAAVLGALPEDSTTADEVRAFVATLLEHDHIAFPGAAAADGRTLSVPTHAVRRRGKKTVLVRARFTCGARV
jgi:hypothetical protein